ncbi:MAG: magnesium-translocating P-type ATPase [Patescibacteria group bacterium]|nr:magnesium-translocating P-type ATPase [Patescibacteria group bacterium]
MSKFFYYILGEPLLSEKLEEYKRKLKDFEFSKKNPKIPVKKQEEIIDNILNFSQQSKDEIFINLETDSYGLSQYEVKKRQFRYGLNQVQETETGNFFIRLFKIIVNPLVILFFLIILVSYLIQDYKSVTTITLMLIISVVLRYVQETKAYNSAMALKSKIITTCTVIRQGKEKEIDLRDVVPGDIVKLSAGDIIPADLRLIEARDLYIDQSFLTGESIPVEKNAEVGSGEISSIVDLRNVCLMGSSVSSGYGKGVVFQTGKNTYFGGLAKNILGRRAITSFDMGIDRFTWLMIIFMSVMVPTVFVINGLTKGDWFEAFLFGVSIAVGLTPHMLPAIITFNLSKGAVLMARKKVIVKLLNSIQNLGAMTVICTDKTGTITLNKVTVIHSLNVDGKEDQRVLEWAFINSLFQTGFKNLLDTAIVDEAKKRKMRDVSREYEKIDEIPFDFRRKRLSIIVRDKKNDRIILICKGAVEEVLEICRQYQINQKKSVITSQFKEKIKKLNRSHASQGYRTIAVAVKEIKDNNFRLEKSEKIEKDLCFLGIITLLDPPKESAREAIKKLNDLGVEIKILTGDNDLVTKKIATDVGLKANNILLGDQIKKMTDDQLRPLIEKTNIFAKLSPDDKKRIVRLLKANNQIVGFLGDGINDAPALREADVGISVDSAVDIAKESADMILLETSLSVLGEGVVEGRKVFGNIVKYIRMGASSNFGNMFSVLGASIFLPFLPMKSSQILVNNLLYDISQTAIPLDNVDQEFIKRPRRWQIKDIARFMIFFGPVSSIFDYVTYFVMLYVFNTWSNQAMFQTGWFIESLATQTLIVHVIRSDKIPFIQTRASLPLTLMTIFVVSLGVFLVNSPFASFFGFAKLPLSYWPILILILLSYITLAQMVKVFYKKRFGYY